MTCLFVPPYLLRRIVLSGDDAAISADQTLRVDAVVRGRRTARFAVSPRAGLAWQVHDAQHSGALPGTPARSEGEPPHADPVVNQVADGIAATLATFAEVYGQHSYDGRGATALITVHFEKHYNNAFWDGAQLVFGDGDGEIFGQFASNIDVLAHEFGHAVTQHTAELAYHDQPGALNESLSDVFASCVRQRLLHQTARQADWLIGAGLFMPGVRARALRDLAAPGTAYDDPRLGRDPQVGHVDDYVEGRDDHGGVHINSGIPNRAFQLAATTLGGTSWDSVGAIWYDALISGDVHADCGFETFARATIKAAAKVSREAHTAVSQAWRRVGIVPSVATSEPRRAVAGSGYSAPSWRPESTEAGTAAQLPVPGQRSARPEELVIVRRSGGFVGRQVIGEIDLASDDPRVPRVRQIVEKVDLAKAREGTPMPDMYSYTFEVCGSGPVCVPEQHLTPNLRALAELVLERL